MGEGRLRLVMAFGVGDCLFTVSAVRESERQTAHVPFLVGLFLESLDVHVWDRHSETIVEANPAQCVWEAEGWHSGDVFGYRDTVGIERVEHFIG